MPSEELTAGEPANAAQQIWNIRPMRQEDVAQCLAIWLKVDLCEAQQTVSSVLATDPGGFYVAELNGRVIGMCSGAMTRDDTAFMGFYAVEGRYRGIGVGRELWARTVARLGADTNIGLYGTPAMSDKYKKSGFVIEDSVRMLIYESTFVQDDASNKPKHNIHPERLSSAEGVLSSCANNWLLISRHKIDINNRETELFQQLVDYDRSVNGYSRKSLLANYLLGDDAPLTVIMLDSRENLFKISGYGCARHDNTGGAMIGPLYADSSEICQVILRRLMQSFPLRLGGKFSAMSLTSNEIAANLLEEVGLIQIDQCTRMFTKFVPSAELSKVYYIHSPNFTLF